jgi:hypothetical protein
LTPTLFLLEAPSRKSRTKKGNPTFTGILIHCSTKIEIKQRRWHSTLSTRSSRRRTDASLLQLARCSRVFATYLDVTSTAICCTSCGVEYNWIFAEWALHWLLAAYAFAVWTGMSRIASVWHLRSCTWKISTYHYTVSPRSPRAILWCSSATIDSVWKQRPLWWAQR